MRFAILVVQPEWYRCKIAAMWAVVTTSAAVSERVMEVQEQVLQPVPEKWSLVEQEQAPPGAGGAVSRGQQEQAPQPALEKPGLSWSGGRHNRSRRGCLRACSSISPALFAIANFALHIARSLALTERVFRFLHAYFFGCL
jgi:hypothetical protein